MLTRPGTRQPLRELAIAMLAEESTFSLSARRLVETDSHALRICGATARGFRTATQPPRKRSWGACFPEHQSDLMPAWSNGGRIWVDMVHERDARLCHEPLFSSLISYRRPPQEIGNVSPLSRFPRLRPPGRCTAGSSGTTCAASLSVALGGHPPSVHSRVACGVVGSHSSDKRRAFVLVCVRARSFIPAASWIRWNSAQSFRSSCGQVNTIGLKLTSPLR